MHQALKKRRLTLPNVSHMTRENTSVHICPKAKTQVRQTARWEKRSLSLLALKRLKHENERFEVCSKSRWNEKCFVLELPTSATRKKIILMASFFYAYQFLLENVDHALYVITFVRCILQIDHLVRSTKTSTYTTSKV